MGAGLADRGRVSVLVLDLDAWGPPEPSAAMLDVLSGEERAKVARFVRVEDRLASAWCRSALRRSLGARLGLPPRDVLIEVSSRGKPAVRGGPAFNVSHTRGVALVALGGDAGIGVDVEAPSGGADLVEIARSHFSARERAAVCEAALGERERRFLRIWARKEAVLKCTGVGIADDLLAIDVWGDEGRPGVHASDDPSWRSLTVVDLDLGPRRREVAAALAIDAGHAEVVLSESAPP
jgi:4'-phosphopantetheinyl transferase